MAKVTVKGKGTATGCYSAAPTNKSPPQKEP